MRILRALLAVLMGGSMLLLPAMPAAAVVDCDAQIVDTTDQQVIANDTAIAAQAQRLVNLGAVVRVRAFQYQPGLAGWVTNQMWMCDSWREPQAVPEDIDPGRRNLVVVAISLDDDALELYTGTDYNSQISQEAADKIRVDYMAPHLRRADDTGQTDQYAAGVAAGLQAVADIIDPNVESELEPTPMSTILLRVMGIIGGLAAVIFVVVRILITLNRRRKRLAAKQAAITAKQKASELFTPLSDAENDELASLRTAIAAFTNDLGTKGSEGLQNRAAQITAQLRQWLDAYSAYTTGTSRADSDPLADLRIAAIDKAQPHDPELPATTEEYTVMAKVFEEIAEGLRQAETARREILKECVHYRVQCNNLINLMSNAAQQVEHAKSEIARRHTGAYRYKTEKADAQLAKAIQHLAEAREDQKANLRLSAMLNTQTATQAALAAFDMAVELPVRHTGLQQELDQLTAQIEPARSDLLEARSILSTLESMFAPARLVDVQQHLASAQQANTNLPHLLDEVRQCLTIEQQDWDGADAHLEQAHNAINLVRGSLESIDHIRRLLTNELNKARELLTQVKATAVTVQGTTTARRHLSLHDGATNAGARVSSVDALLQSGNPIDPAAVLQELRTIAAELRNIEQRSDYIVRPRTTHTRVGRLSHGLRSRSSASRTPRSSSRRRSRGRRSGGSY